MRTKHTIDSEELRLDSACSLLNPNHEIPRLYGDVFDTIREILQDRDPGCDVVIGAAGCGGCVNESCDYAVFYTGQDPGLDRTIGLCYDTGAREEGRDPALTREQLGRVVVEAASRRGVETSWTGSVSDRVYLGDDSVYDD